MSFVVFWKCENFRMINYVQNSFPVTTSNLSILDFSVAAQTQTEMTSSSQMVNKFGLLCLGFCICMAIAFAGPLSNEVRDKERNHPFNKSLKNAA